MKSMNIIRQKFSRIVSLSTFLFIGISILMSLIVTPTNTHAMLICDDPIRGTNNCGGSTSTSAPSLTVINEDSPFDWTPWLIGGGSVLLLVIVGGVTWYLKKK